MYDKRLDAVVKAAELGSFSKAANEMGYSIPALIKQINGIEGQLGVTIFDRSNKGVCLTPAGRVLVQEAHGIIDRSNLALQKIRHIQMQADNRVRLGISTFQSGQRILDLCRDLYLRGTDLSVQFIPVADYYDLYKRTIANLGNEIDVIASAPLREEDLQDCCATVLESSPLCLGVSVSDVLAAYDTVPLSELAGRRVRVPAPGNDQIDAARAEIAEHAPGVTFIEFPYYEVTLFDECAQSGDVLLTSEFWREAHPLLATVNVPWDKTMPYCLYHPKDPKPAVRRFVQEIKQLAR